MTEEVSNSIDKNLKLLSYFETGGCMSVLLSLEQNEINDLYAFARHLFSNKDFHKACKFFYLLTWLEHHNYDYTLSLGLSYLNIKKYEDALMCFRRCATLKINDPRSSYYAGICYIKTNLKEHAKKAFDTCMALATKNEDQDYKYMSMTLIKTYKL